MYRQGIIIFCLAIVNPLLCYGKVDMAADPILEYLNLDPKSVLEHELINFELPNNIHKRSIRSHRFEAGGNITIRAFGSDINLWLHPRDSLLVSTETPFYFANVDFGVPNGVSYIRQEGIMARVGQLFEDVEHYASLVIGSDTQTNGSVVTGHVSLKEDNAAIIIRPLPAHIVEEHLRKRRSINENDDDSSLNSARHVAVKIKDQFSNNYIGDSLEKINVRKNSMPPMVNVDDDWDADNMAIHQNSPVIDSNNSVTTLYPKLFLHHDSTYFKESFKNRESEELLRFLEYVLAFWNGVDLTYRQLENPGIRLHITGIAVATHYWATPYFAANMHNDYMQDLGAFKGATRFFHTANDQIPINTYHVAVSMTMLEMDNSVAGVAYVRSVCLSADTGKKGVALIHDNGGFSGIAVAVHEIGHTLGLYHDEDYPGCENSKGYIMAKVLGASRNGVTFSNCSLTQFNYALGNRSLECTYDPPQKAVALPRLMPGRMKTLDEQCRAYGYQKACSPAKRICVNLHCLLYPYEDEFGNLVEGGCVRREHGAAPGTPCGNTTLANPRFCLHQRCVRLDKPRE